MVHIYKVGIRAVYVVLLKGFINPFQHVAVGIEVIAVQNSHHIASGMGYAAVHSIIQSIVFLRKDSQPARETLFVAVGNVERCVGR